RGVTTTRKAGPTYLYCFCSRSPSEPRTSEPAYRQVSESPAPGRDPLLFHDPAELLVRLPPGIRPRRIDHTRRRVPAHRVQVVVEQRRHDRQLERSHQEPEMPWHGGKIEVEALRDRNQVGSVLVWIGPFETPPILAHIVAEDRRKEPRFRD